MKGITFSKAGMAALALAFMVMMAGCPNVTEPEKPSKEPETEIPGNPNNPGDPSRPGDPVNPGDPGNPNNPGDPGNPGNPGDPGNPGNPGNPGTGGNRQLSLGHLSKMAVNISDATGLGIQSRAVPRPVTSVSLGRSARAAQDAPAKKNYLVKSTGPDAGALVNVTFTKQNPGETVTMPVYDADGNPVYEVDENGKTLKDEEGNPVQKVQAVPGEMTQDEIPAQVNRLYVYNNYTFIQFVPTVTSFSITQPRPGYNGSDPMGGGGIIQGPIYSDPPIQVGVEDLRPSEDGLYIQGDYYSYDAGPYYNNEYHQSFIIENTTGNIYSLGEDVYIRSIQGGLLKIKDIDKMKERKQEIEDSSNDPYGGNYGYYGQNKFEHVQDSPLIWDYRINQDGELEIFPLFDNTAIATNGYFKDRHGNNYVKNTTLDTTNSATNTVLYKDHFYQTAKTGDVVFANGKMEVQNIDGYNSTAQAITGATEIRIMGAGLTPRAIAPNDYLEFYDGSVIKNQELYWVNALENNSIGYSMSIKGVIVVDTSTAAIKRNIRLDDNYDKEHYKMLSYDTVLIRGGNGSVLPSAKLYYYKFDFAALPESNKQYVFTADSSRVPDTSNEWNAAHYANYYAGYQVFGEGLTLLFAGLTDNSGVYGPFSTMTLSGQTDYDVVFKEVDGEKIPEGITVSEYEAEKQAAITLKPINRQ